MATGPFRNFFRFPPVRWVGLWFLGLMLSCAAPQEAPEGHDVAGKAGSDGQKAEWDLRLYDVAATDDDVAALAQGCDGDFCPLALGSVPRTDRGEIQIVCRPGEAGCDPTIKPAGGPAEVLSCLQNGWGPENGCGIRRTGDPQARVQPVALIAAPWVVVPLGAALLKAVEKAPTVAQWALRVLVLVERASAIEEPAARGSAIPEHVTVPLGLGEEGQTHMAVDATAVEFVQAWPSDLGERETGDPAALASHEVVATAKAGLAAAQDRGFAQSATGDLDQAIEQVEKLSELLADRYAEQQKQDCGHWMQRAQSVLSEPGQALIVPWSVLEGGAGSALIQGLRRAEQTYQTRLGNNLPHYQKLDLAGLALANGLIDLLAKAFGNGPSQIAPAAGAEQAAAVVVAAICDDDSDPTPKILPKIVQGSRGLITIVIGFNLGYIPLTMERGGADRFGGPALGGADLQWPNRTDQPPFKPTGTVVLPPSSENPRTVEVYGGFQAYRRAYGDDGAALPEDIMEVFN